VELQERLAQRELQERLAQRELQERLAQRELQERLARRVQQEHPEHLARLGLPALSWQVKFNSGF